MMKIKKGIIAVWAVSALVLGAYGCQNKSTPAEDAGKKIDQTIDKADQKIDSAVDKAGHEIKKVGEGIEDSVKDSRK